MFINVEFFYKLYSKGYNLKIYMNAKVINVNNVDTAKDTNSSVSDPNIPVIITSLEFCHFYFKFIFIISIT